MVLLLNLTVYGLTNTVNANASQRGRTWIVNMYGGLARRPEITPDGFAMVLCHELGHHMGGFPFVSGWAANEGQSDLFATLSCGRILLVTTQKRMLNTEILSQHIQKVFVTMLGKLEKSKIYVTV